MSRAFIRESDQAAAAEILPERPLSPHPNFVTAAGLEQIEAQVRSLEAARQAARAAQDEGERARIERELRYWSARRASARVIEPARAPDAVRFGVRVRLRLEDGSERAFRLVGEDEADPARGLLSWVSPLARTLLGKARGDVVEFQGAGAEIVALEP